MIETRKSIDLPAHAHLEAAVLGDAPLGDVEFAHDLDARDDRPLEAAVERLGGPEQHAVDPVFDDDPFLAGLDVDVAGPLVQGIEQGRIDQADDRAGIVGHLLDGEDFLALVGLLDQLQLEILGDLLQHLLRALAPLDQVGDLPLGGDHMFEPLVEQHLQIIEAAQARRIGDGHGQAIGVLPHRHAFKAHHQLGRDHFGQFGTGAESARDR